MNTIPCCKYRIFYRRCEKGHISLFPSLSFKIWPALKKYVLFVLIICTAGQTLIAFLVGLRNSLQENQIFLNIYLQVQGFTWKHYVRNDGRERLRVSVYKKMRMNTAHSTHWLRLSARYLPSSVPRGRNERSCYYELQYPCCERKPSPLHDVPGRRC